MSPSYQLTTDAGVESFPSILVVDDDPDIRTLVRLIVEEDGYPVIEAADGRAALDVLRARPMTAFVVILDYRMPRMDGWELLRILTSDAALFQRHAVVLLTANGAHLPADFRRLLAQHAIPIVDKPFQVEALSELVKRAAYDVGQPSTESGW